MAENYRAYASELDPAYQRALSTMLSGQLSPAAQRYYEQSRQRGLGDISGMYGARGTPTGAMAAAKRQYLTDTAMQQALASQQMQTQGLQYGLPYMQHQAAQYWMPEQMEMQRYQLQKAYEEQPWYLDVLGAAGGLAGDVLAPGLSRLFTNQSTPPPTPQLPNLYPPPSNLYGLGY